MRTFVHASALDGIKRFLLTPIPIPGWLNASSFAQRITSVRARRNWWRTATWLGDSIESVQQSFLRMFALAHAERLPQGPLFDHFASEQRGLRRFRYRRFAHRVTSGMTPIDAIEQTPGVLDEEYAFALRFGTQTGTMSQTLAYLQSERKPSQSLSMLSSPHLVFMTSAILLLISYWVTLLYQDHLSLAAAAGAGMPMSLKLLISLVYLFPILLLALAAVVVVRVCMAFSARVRRRVRRWVGKWRARCGLSSRTASVMHLLAIATEAGRPIEGSLSTLARYHYDRHLRGQLLFVRNEVEQGSEVWESLQQAKLLTSAEAVAIRECPGASSRAWLMHQLARQRDEASALRNAKLITIGSILLLLLAASMAMLVGVAHFQFLNELAVSIGY